MKAFCAKLMKPWGYSTEWLTGRQPRALRPGTKSPGSLEGHSLRTTSRNSPEFGFLKVAPAPEDIIPIGASFYHEVAGEQNLLRSELVKNNGGIVEAAHSLSLEKTPFRESHVEVVEAAKAKKNKKKLQDQGKKKGGGFIISFLYEAKSEICRLNGDTKSYEGHVLMEPAAGMDLG